MTLWQAEAYVQGDAAVSSDASASYASAATLEGDAGITGDVDALFAGASSVSGDASTSAFAQYLVSAALSGDSSTAAPGALKAAGEASVEGDAGAGASATMALVGAASPLGDASVLAPASVLWKGEVEPMGGDAEVVAVAMEDYEIAADLRGDASMPPVVGTMDYGAVGGLTGEATLTALPIRRRPYVPVVLPPEEPSKRSLGYQPDRKPVVKEPTFVVSPNPPRRRG